MDGNATVPTTTPEAECDKYFAANDFNEIRGLPGLASGIITSMCTWLNTEQTLQKEIASELIFFFFFNLNSGFQVLVCKSKILVHYPAFF